MKRLLNKIKTVRTKILAGFLLVALITGVVGFVGDQPDARR